MADLIKNLLNVWVLVYLLVVIIAAIVPGRIAIRRQRRLQAQRRDAGLGKETILGPGSRLARIREEALVESLVFLAAVLFVPFVLSIIAQIVEDDASASLSTAFAFLLLWVLLNGTDVGKAFLGGMAFWVLLGVRRPFQVGDRVTLVGHSGRVDEIGLFHVRLTTADDDAVSIPTCSLWSQTLVSANAGDRSSLCVMDFYLAPNVTAEQRRTAEDTIWEAIQASVYFDTNKFFQIHCTQHVDSIQLTGKAYVANTYREPDFRNDVTSRVLDVLAEKSIPLANAHIYPKLDWLPAANHIGSAGE